MLNHQTLQSISPIDGRYASLSEPLRPYFSEMALIQYRVKIEIAYLIRLCEIPLPQLASFPSEQFDVLRKIEEQFSLEDAMAIKSIEKITNHDVKAVEYYLKQLFEKLGLGAHKEFVHFGLTSQDINNTAMPLAFKDAMNMVYLPALRTLTETMKEKESLWNDVPMLAYTHGQPASPTRLGKEFRVFTERIEEQLLLFHQIPYSAKFGGATGNFNAHAVAYPTVHWKKFADEFIEHLGLRRAQTTTQIEHYDHLAAQLDTLKRINTILVDFARDVWAYVSMNYFKGEIKPGEVGSSAMPHKVNPIDFENAEGNLLIANALLEFLSAKLPVSRLQRDLTDSTVLRNLGVPIAHSLIAIKSLIRGLGRIVLNQTKIDDDLLRNWMVVAEGIQTILRREGYPDPYEALKALTRTHAVIGQAEINEFIDGLAVSDVLKQELKRITPFNYTGV